MTEASNIIRYGGAVDENIQSVWIEFDMSKDPHKGTIVIEFRGNPTDVPTLWTELTKTVKQALGLE
jgi:hypothetical protein